MPALEVLLLSAACVASMCVLPSEVQACGGGGPVPPTPRALEAATAVFVGTVERLTDEPPSRIVATFFVTKWYKDVTPQRIAVWGYCGSHFERGQAYLVYAEARAGRWITTPMNRTRPLSAAGEDLRYLDHLHAGRPQGLVYGQVWRRVPGPDGKPTRRALFETVAVVAVTGGERRMVPTDQWGPFQIVLAPGEYTLWVERSGRRVSPRETVHLRARDELRVTFTASW